MSLRAGLLGLGALLLAACATHAPRAPLPPLTRTPEANQQQREALLATQQSWSLQGRVALSNGRDGGSGRIDWQQDGGHYDMSLSAPVTRQSWRITGDGSHARLDGIAGGPLEGDDPVALLRETTRWDIPVTALASWVRGVPADKAQHGRAGLEFGPDGRLATLRQGGWTVHYTVWQPQAPVELPQRLEASRDDAKVRLVVDAWGPAPGP
jgi:outer membrane lipoprotein LolB